MVNDGFADRTLPPTERHRREARLRGQVALSPELTSALVLLTASGALWFLAPTAANALVGSIQKSITSASPSSFTVGTLVELTHLASRIVVTIVAPILLMTFIGGLLANLAQTGWVWNPSVIIPQFRRGGLISEDSATRGMTTFLRFCLMICVTVRFLTAHSWQLRAVGLDEPTGMLVQPSRMVGELTIQLAFSLFLLSVFDYGFRFWRNEQRLKMTVEERRREQRDETADPQIKKRRTELSGRQAFALLAPEIERIEATRR